MHRNASHACSWTCFVHVHMSVLKVVYLCATCLHLCPCLHVCICVCTPVCSTQDAIERRFDTGVFDDESSKPQVHHTAPSASGPKPRVHHIAPSTSAPQAAGTPHARPTPARRDVVWISGAPLRCVHACRQAAQQRRLQCMHMGEPPMCATWGLGGRDLDIFVLPFYSLSPPLSRAPPPLPYPLGGCCENSTEIFRQPLCGRKSPLGQQLSEETQNQPQIKPRTNSTTNGSSRCVGSWHEQPTLRSH